MLLIDLDMKVLDIASTYLNVAASDKHLVKAEPKRLGEGEPKTHKQDAEREHDFFKSLQYYEMRRKESQINVIRFSKSKEQFLRVYDFMSLSLPHQLRKSIK